MGWASERRICNVSHWLSPNPEWSLIYTGQNHTAHVSFLLTLVQIMTCCRFITKPFQESMFTYWDNEDNALEMTANGWVNYRSLYTHIPSFMYIHIDGLVQDCSNNTVELLQSCAKPSLSLYIYMCVCVCQNHAAHMSLSIIYKSHQLL